MIKFTGKAIGSILPSSLVYIPEEEAFNFQPFPETPCGILSAGMLELCVDVADNHVLSVSGRDPHTTWKKISLSPPSFKQSALYVTNHEFKPGIGIDLFSEKWPSRYVDLEKGWVCIGDPEAQGEAIEFAPSCGAVLDNGEMRAIWLHPKELPRDSGSKTSAATSPT